MNPVLRNMAIDAFLKTYDADPVAGRILLERLLDPERLKTSGPYEFNTIGYQLKYVKDLEALDLAYRIGFTDIEQPGGQVGLGAASALFGYSEDAKQPQRSMRWALAEQYPSVLEASPRVAVRALRSALDQANHVKRPGSHAFEISRLHCNFSFDFDDDGDGSYALDDCQRMRKAFEARLAGSLQAGDRRYADTIMSEASKDAIPTTFLRMLLRNAQHDQGLALELLPVVTSPKALRGYDLATSIADYLATALEPLDRGSRASIESALLDLATTKGDKRRRADQRRLETYLVSIPDGVLVDAKLVDLREAATENELSEEDRSLRLRGTWTGPATMRAPHLSDGAEIDGTPLLVVALIDEAEELMPHQRPSPKPERLVPLARELQVLLPEAEGEVRERLVDVAAALVEYALQYRHATVEDVTDLAPLIIAAANGLHPLPPSADDPDRERISWGWPNARILAAQLLGQLYAATEDEAYLEGLRRLTNDPSTAVRSHATEAAPFVASINAEAAWEIVERASSDASLSVARTAIVTAGTLSGLDVARYRRLEFSLFDRLFTVRPEAELTADLQRNLLWRALTGDDDATERLAGLLEAPWTIPERGKRIALDMVHIFRFRHVDASLRLAARDGLYRLLNKVIEHLRRSAIDRGLPESKKYLVREGTDGSQPGRVACAQILVEVTERLYFDSGAYEADEGRATQQAPTSEFTAAHFEFVEPLLRLLAPIPYTQVSYNVLKILQPAIRFDAAKVLGIASQAIRAGISDNLTNEQLGQQQAASLVREYVERHRGLLTGDRDALQVVMDTIDAFADAGWPEWIDLVFTMDGIYRD